MPCSKFITAPTTLGEALKAAGMDDSVEGGFLCDWPMGRGKTCDAPLCREHARPVGEDRDMCEVHWTMFVASVKSGRLLPFAPSRHPGPRIVK